MKNPSRQKKSKAVLYVCGACVGAALLAALLGSREPMAPTTSQQGERLSREASHPLWPGQQGDAPSANRRSLDSGAPSTRAVSFRVVSEENGPIVGAELCLVGTPGVPTVAKTTAAGEAELPLPTFPATVVARAAGYVDREVELTENPTELLEIVLKRQFFLAGVLHRADGEPLGGDIWVAAWRGAEQINSRELGFRLRSEGSGEIYVASCNPDGTFEVSVPDDSSEYCLTAGGSGWAAIDPVCVVGTPNRSDVSLALRAIYGSRLQFCGPGGNPPVMSSQLHFLHFPKISCDEPLRVENAHRASMALAGLQPEAFDLHSTFDMILVASLDAQRERSGRLTVDIEAPGYVPILTDLTLPFLGRGMDVVEMPMEPTATGFGDLVVVLEEEAGDRVSANNLLDTGGMKLILQPASGGEKISLMLRRFVSGRCLLQGIPRGTYRALLQGWDNSIQDLEPSDDNQRAAPVVIADEPFYLNIPHLAVGAVEFDVRYLDGKPFEGDCRINIGRMLASSPGKRSAFSYFFTGRPYRIPILREGLYAGFFDGPWFQDISVDGSYEFFLDISDSRTLRVLQPASVSDSR